MRRRRTATEPGNLELRLDSAKHLQRELPVGRLPQRHRPIRQYGARRRAVVSVTWSTWSPPTTRPDAAGFRRVVPLDPARSFLLIKLVGGPTFDPALRKSDAEDRRALVGGRHRTDSGLDSGRCASAESLCRDAIRIAITESDGDSFTEPDDRSTRGSDLDSNANRPGAVTAAPGIVAVRLPLMLKRTRAPRPG